jgi:hypothetical protein
MTKEEILEAYDDLIDENTEILMADGFDDAIVGLCCNTLRVIYDYDLMIEILEDEGMEEMEAIEHLEFNVINAYVGPQTPIFMI